jgi:hypothetical protein
MRNNIVSFDKLLEPTLKAALLMKRKEVFEEKEGIIMLLKRQAGLKSLRGKLRWEGHIENMRTDK